MLKYFFKTYRQVRTGRFQEEATTSIINERERWMDLARLVVAAAKDQPNNKSEIESHFHASCRLDKDCIFISQHGRPCCCIDLSRLGKEEKVPGSSDETTRKGVYVTVYSSDTGKPSEEKIFFKNGIDLSDTKTFKTFFNNVGLAITQVPMSFSEKTKEYIQDIQHKTLNTSSVFALKSALFLGDAVNRILPRRMHAPFFEANTPENTYQKFSEISCVYMRPEEMKETLQKMVPQDNDKSAEQLARDHLGVILGDMAKDKGGNLAKGVLNHQELRENFTQNFRQVIDKILPGASSGAGVDWNFLLGDNETLEKFRAALTSHRYVLESTEEGKQFYYNAIKELPYHIESDKSKLHENPYRKLLEQKYGADSSYTPAQLIWQGMFSRLGIKDTVLTKQMLELQPRIEELAQVIDADKEKTLAPSGSIMEQVFRNAYIDYSTSTKLYPNDQFFALDTIHHSVNKINTEELRTLIDDYALTRGKAKACLAVDEQEGVLSDNDRACLVAVTKTSLITKKFKDVVERCSAYLRLDEERIERFYLANELPEAQAPAQAQAQSPRPDKWQEVNAELQMASTSASEDSFSLEDFIPEEPPQGTPAPEETEEPPQGTPAPEETEEPPQETPAPEEDKTPSVYDATSTAPKVIQRSANQEHYNGQAHGEAVPEDEHDQPSGDFGLVDIPEVRRRDRDTGNHP